MAEVILFHSVYGLRPAEHAAADRLHAAGHEASTPDLFAGQTAASVDEGFELVQRIGWDVICARAAQALADLPDTTVLAGISMGAAVVASLLPQRPRTAGILLLHGVVPLPPAPRPALPVQVHLAEPDPFEPEEVVADWQAASARAGLAAQVFRYPGAGHYFTDPTLPDYDADASRVTWKRAIAFLDGL